MKLIVNRPFLWEGRRLETGATLETDDRGLIGMLVQTGKAVPTEDAPQRGPMTTETAAGVVSGKTPRAGTHKPVAEKTPTASPTTEGTPP